MYGKLSAIFVAVAYLTPIILFIFRQKISKLIIKIMIKSEFIKNGDMPIPVNITQNVFIFFLLISILCAFFSIVLGHYSKSLSEEHGVWLNYIIGLGYIYFSLLILIYFAIKNFSMSGYR